MIEARITTKPQSKKTNAPEPIKPVSGNEVPTTDMDQLSIKDWMAAREKQIQR
jgi:hypothetical protein